jgi:hypothetical protein
VAKGHSQKPGIDYNDAFAPVGDKVILRFVLSFALHLGYELYQLDIDTAYLYGNLKETMYMIHPEGFDDGSGRVCLLQKCIYGLKQSGREWYFVLSNFLKSIGFEICPKDPCLLVKDEVLLFIYVDDILVMSKTKQVYERFGDLLKTEFKIKEVGKPKHILGVRVEFVKNRISLFRRQYIEEIVHTFCFHKGNKVYTSMEPHWTPRKFLESEDKEFDPHLYRQLIESLMQLATWTIPDILYSVSILS